MNWFYSKDNQQAGPVEDAELAQLVQSGVITDATLVWHSGLANWQPYAVARGGAAGLLPPAIAAPTVGGVGPVNLGKTLEPGTAQCSQCGRVLPADEVVQIGGANVCAECKPVFLQRLREGAVVLSRPYAGFGIRFGAAFLDSLILIPLWVLYFGVFFVFLVPRLAAANQDPGAAMSFQLINLGMSLGLQVVIATYSAFCVSRYGGTPGKRICKLRVVRGDTNGPVTFWRALGRYLSKAFISRLILGIGYLFIVFDDQKRALHDMICDTRVIRES